MSYQSRTCDNCGGALQAVDRHGQALARGVLFCPYCDSYYERQQDAATVSIINVAKQAVIDCANMRERSAADKISEAQKINDGHAVTLIVSMLYDSLLADQSGNVNQQIAARLMKNRKKLETEYPTITDEENAFYDAVDDASGYAVLTALFLYLKDKPRFDYALSLTKIEFVDTEYANNKLLKALVTVQRIDEVKKLIEGPNKFDLNNGLRALLDLPESEMKVNLFDSFAMRKGLSATEKKTLTAYLEGSQDGAESKAKISAAFAVTPAKLDVEQILRYSLADCQDPQIVAETIQKLSAERLTQNQIQQLIDFLLVDHGQSYDMIHAGLEALTESEQLIAISPLQCNHLIGYTRFSVDELSVLYTLCFKLGLDDRGKNAVLTDFLLGIPASYAERGDLAKRLLMSTGTILLSTFEKYLMSPAWSQDADAAMRLPLLEQMMAQGVEGRYCASIVSKYLEANFDQPEIKATIITFLFSKQIVPSSGSILVFATAADLSPEQKLEILRSAQSAGGALPGQLLDRLISAGITYSQAYGLLDFSFGFATTLSDGSVVRYVLDCEEPAAQRQQHFDKVFEVAARVGMQECAVDYQSMRLSCNLAQAYVLRGIDPPDLVIQVTRRMENSGAKLKENILVDGNKVGFKKFFKEHAKQVSAELLQLM